MSTTIALADTSHGVTLRPVEIIWPQVGNSSPWKFLASMPFGDMCQSYLEPTAFIMPEYHYLSKTFEHNVFFSTLFQNFFPRCTTWNRFARTQLARYMSASHMRVGFSNERKYRRNGWESMRVRRQRMCSSNGILIDQRWSWASCHHVFNNVNNFTRCRYW